MRWGKLELVRRSVGLVAAAGMLAGPAIFAAQPFAQLPGLDACVSATGNGGDCAAGIRLPGVSGAAVSPDGRNVYVTASGVGGDVIAVFDRDLMTGALTQKASPSACVAQDDIGGDCVDGEGLDGAASVVVSPDNLNVYTVAGTSDAVGIFDRNLSTGVITQKGGTAGCIQLEDANGDDPCLEGRGLNSVLGLALSPDGRNLYTTATASSAVAVFDRDPESGALTQKEDDAGCIDTGQDIESTCASGPGLLGVIGVAVSPDGRNVYTASLTGDAVAIFDRSLVTGALTQHVAQNGCVSDAGLASGCIEGVALDGASGVAVSPDGRHVYAASQVSDAVVIFDRHPITGALTQKAGTAGCVSETGSGGECADGAGLDEAGSVIVSPDGASVYVSTESSDGVALFARDLETGELTQFPGIAGCITIDGSAGACTQGKALDLPLEVVASPDGRNLYVSATMSSAVAVLSRVETAYDIDGNGEIDPLTDGVLLLRHTFGFSGATLVTGAFDDVGCTRCTAAAIEAWIEALSAP